MMTPNSAGVEGNREFTETHAVCQAQTQEC